MFENVGVKIKGIAKVFFAVGILVPLVCGIVVIAHDKNMAPIGIIIIFLGALLAWLATVLLYGFGELIHMTSQIESIVSANKASSNKDKNENGYIKNHEHTKTHSQTQTKFAKESKFVQEIDKMSTEDLMFILRDQQNLYSETELNYIRYVVQSRHTK